MPRYKLSQFSDALKSTKGMVYLAADVLHCSPQTMLTWIRAHPELQTLIESESEKVTDTAELKLLVAITKGEPWAITYRLSRKGKKRGYGESIQLDINILRDEARRLAAETGLNEADILAEAEQLLGVKIG